MIIFASIFDGQSYHFFDQMTRILFVLRHAQSVGKQSDQPDYDRILTAEGEVMAKVLGRKLKQQNYNIDLILSSRAARSRHTVEYVNEVLQLQMKKFNSSTNYMRPQWSNG